MSKFEKYARGRHYSEVASSGRPQNKRQRTNEKTTKFHRKISIGSINTTTTKDPLKLAQCILQCKTLNHSITFIQETHVCGKNTIEFEKDSELFG